MERALIHTKPTVNQEDLVKIQEFMDDFGQEA